MGKNEHTMLKAPRGDCRETAAAQPLYPPTPPPPPPPPPTPSHFRSYLPANCLQGATLPGPAGDAVRFRPQSKPKSLLSAALHGTQRMGPRSSRGFLLPIGVSGRSPQQNPKPPWGAGRAGVEQSSCTARPCPRSVLLQYTLTKIEISFHINTTTTKKRKRNPHPPKKKTPVFCTVSIADIVKLAIYSYGSRGVKYYQGDQRGEKGERKAQQERDLLIQHGFWSRDGDGGSENAMLVFGSVSKNNGVKRGGGEKGGKRERGVKVGKGKTRKASVERSPQSPGRERRMGMG